VSIPVTKKPSKPARPASQPSFSSALSGVHLLYPVLMGCDLQILDPPKKGEKSERFYDAVLRPVPADEKNKAPRNLAIAACEFVAGTRTKEAKIIEISATYLIAIDCDAEGDAPEVQTRALLVEFARASAWPMYRDLFIHMGSQTGLELPLLPNDAKLRWARSDDHKEEKQESSA
jgi:hypothetical protein